MILGLVSTEPGNWTCPAWQAGFLDHLASPSLVLVRWLEDFRRPQPPERARCAPVLEYPDVWVYPLQQVDISSVISSLAEDQEKPSRKAIKKSSVQTGSLTVWVRLAQRVDFPVRPIAGLFGAGLSRWRQDWPSVRRRPDRLAGVPAALAGTSARGPGPQACRSALRRSCSASFLSSRGQRAGWRQAPLQL